MEPFGPLQVKLTAVALLAVNLSVAPAQIGPLLLAVTLGPALTVAVVVALPVQPPASSPLPCKFRSPQESRWLSRDSEDSN